MRPALVGALVLMVACQPGDQPALPAWRRPTASTASRRAQLEPIEEADLHNALVIVYAERWLEYGAMLAEMSPTLDDDVVYARGNGAEIDAAVIADYPGRSSLLPDRTASCRQPQSTLRPREFQGGRMESCHNAMEWLLEQDAENPGVRYFALTDLLDRRSGRPRGDRVPARH